MAFSTARGLWALAAFMLPLAAYGATSVPALMAAIDAVDDDGWSLLHKAVLSGDSLMCQVTKSALCPEFATMLASNVSGIVPGDRVACSSN